ncbi:hypothetical protein, partial [Haemophilus parainfluenzae]|uniref:hypothetical protein n=1 Tax=Haemophilus parainfluenzae TaxID=729 RepID=UPI001CEDE942
HSSGVAPYVQLEHWRWAWRQVQTQADYPGATTATDNAALAVWRATVLALWLNRMQGGLDLAKSG